MIGNLLASLRFRQKEDSGIVKGWIPKLGFYHPAST